MIKELLEKLKQKKARMNDAEEEVKIQRVIQQKQKNSNERELESYLEEERQKRIKKSLDFYRKKRLNEYWSGNSIMKNNKKMLNNLPKQKNLFGGKSSILRTR